MGVSKFDKNFQEELDMSGRYVKSRQPRENGLGRSEEGILILGLFKLS
jgi:hypothetical protein